MSDHDSTDPGDLRAEAALQQALTEVDRVGDSARIDPSAVRRRATVRSRMKIGGSALAVLLIAGGVAGTVQLTRGDESNATTASAYGTGPQPEPGWRFEYYRDIRVSVPKEWVYDSEPGSDWCASDGGEGFPDRPYIDFGHSGSVMAIGCPSTDGGGGFSDEPPSDFWVTHLTLVPYNEEDETGSSQSGDWWVLREHVGSVMVKAVSKDKAEAEQLLATATVVDDDAGGCYPHGAIQDSAFPRPDPAFDVAALADVDAIIVCQYTDLLDDKSPGLSGSTVIAGAEADDILAAIKAAPPGGGPNRPANCMDDDPGDSAIELFMHSGTGTHVMYLYYSTCHGNGFDDGTTIRELTLDACPPLIVEPVRILMGSSVTFERCAPL